MPEARRFMSIPDRLIESWNGADYERQSAHQRAWGTGIVAELPLRGDERILDLGCGDGGVTRRLAERVPGGFVLGIDAAAGQLEAAREKCLPNMRVELLDIDALGFEAEFDCIYSNATLHWVHDHDALLRRVHRALRPGGILRAQFGGDRNVPNLLDCLRLRMTAPPFDRAFAGFRWPWYFPAIPEYKERLRASPFGGGQAWLEAKPQRFDTAEALIGWIDNPCLIPFVQALPAELRRPFRDGVVADMLARTLQADGGHLEPFSRMNVWARKAA
jgi:trans-aconitate methyltransferase